MSHNSDNGVNIDNSEISNNSDDKRMTKAITVTTASQQ